VDKRTSSKKPAEKDQIAPGGELDALCGKCKKATLHIILAVLKGKPSRVECKPCGSSHSYRPPKVAEADSDATKTTAAAKKPATKAKPRSRTAASAAQALSPQDAWAAAMKKASSTPVKYAMSGRYDPGQRLTHPTFGEGVVIGVSSATVCSVIFPDATRKLVMAK
jgi:hypothetical protein